MILPSRPGVFVDPRGISLSYTAHVEHAFLTTVTSIHYSVAIASDLILALTSSGFLRSLIPTLINSGSLP